MCIIHQRMDDFPANQQEVVQNKAGVSTQNLDQKHLVWVSELFPLLWGEVLGLASLNSFTCKMGTITPGLWVLVRHPASGGGHHHKQATDTYQQSSPAPCSPGQTALGQPARSTRAFSDCLGSWQHRGEEGVIPSQIAFSVSSPSEKTQPMALIFSYYGQHLANRIVKGFL